MRSSSRLKLTIVFLLLLVFIFGLVLRGLGSEPARAASSSHVWRVVASPNIGANSILYAVAATSANNAWAVGSWYNANPATVMQTLIEHWNGKQWRIVTSPSAGTWDALYAVKALSPSDVWAVGSSFSNNSALIEHYNGIQWSIVSSPSLASYGGGSLNGMTVLSSTNIWAAGYAGDGGGQSTLIEHYDGIQWSIVPSPNADNYTLLKSINAASASDIWAVGTSYSSPDSSDNSSTVIEHWNGVQWSVVGSPSPGYDDSLNAVIAIASNDVRAVGEASGNSYVLAEHWNGIQWTYGAPPDGGLYENYLDGETAFATNNVWAVGAAANASPSYAMKTLVEHWNGTRWSIVSSPNSASTYNELLGIAKVPNTTTLWSVGDTGTGTLIEFYS